MQYAIAAIVIIALPVLGYAGLVLYSHYKGKRANNWGPCPKCGKDLTNSPYRCYSGGCDWWPDETRV
jgi:hypothetical protein